jgi:triacylglycerol lipase
MSSLSPPPPSPQRLLRLVLSVVAAAVFVALAVGNGGGGGGGADALLSDTFQAFLVKRYGESTRALYTREEMAPAGGVPSYGGGTHRAGQPTARVPCVFVHGMVGNATVTWNMRNYFAANGSYLDEELYATSYGPAKNGSMLCEYARVVRGFIRAVAEFTAAERVNVLGYSLGSPVARKAILGGRCVDTGENLGKPLSKLVDTFVSVAGVVQGFPMCNCAFENCSSCIAPQVSGFCDAALFGAANNERSCNPLTGCVCGSAYLNDINRVAVTAVDDNVETHYEGAHVLSIMSTADEWIGYENCGRLGGHVPGSDDVLILPGLAHYPTSQVSMPQQLSYVMTHKLVAPKL